MTRGRDNKGGTLRIRTFAAFAAGVVVAASGTAFATTKVAAIVGPDNQIHGCYLTSAGLLRVVAAGSACREGESPIAWTATGAGPQGPVGPVGPVGPAGAKGDPGARWRGAWVSGTAYSAGDLVRRDGSVWIVRSGVGCLILNPNCSNTVGPPSNPIWTRFAQDGAVGAVGPQGAAGPQGPAGARGLQGPAGPKGDAGAQGPAGGISGSQTVTGPSVNIPAVSSRSATVSCPSGKIAVSGGFTTGAGNLLTSRPSTDGRSWNVSVGNDQLVFATSFTPYAVCVNG
jgi:hypothetical protein